MTDPIATPAVAVRTAHAGEPGHPRHAQRSPKGKPLIRAKKLPHIDPTKPYKWISNLDARDYWPQDDVFQGPPRPTKTYSVAELTKMHIIGIYKNA